MVRKGRQPAQVSLDDAKQIATFTFPDPIKIGRYKLELEFEGKLGRQAQGLFYEKYQMGSGEKILLATQMKPTDARRMFPCWDEPAYRATFQLTAVLPEKFMAVSNMPVASEKLTGNGLKTVTFTRTPRMSTYLLALIAGELEALAGERRSASGENSQQIRGQTPFTDRVFPLIPPLLDLEKSPPHDVIIEN